MSSIQNIQSPNYYQGVEQGPVLNLSLLTEQATKSLQNFDTQAVAAELNKAKQLALSGDQVAIDTLLNLNLNPQSKLSAMAAETLKALYLDPNTPQNIKTAIGESTTDFAEAVHKYHLGDPKQIDNRLVFVAGDHCQHSDLRQSHHALKGYIQSLAQDVKFVREELADSIHNPTRTVSPDEVDTTSALLNRQPDGKIHAAKTLVMTARDDRTLDLNTNLREAKTAAQEQGKPLFVMPILNNGHFILALGSADENEHKVCFIDSLQGNSTPDWLSSHKVNADVIYAGGNFQDASRYKNNPDSPTHNGCGAFCSAAMKFLSQPQNLERVKSEEKFDVLALAQNHTDWLVQMEDSEREAMIASERQRMLASALSPAL